MRRSGGNWPWITPRLRWTRRDMALFAFAAKLTLKPDEITQHDVDALYREKWDETALIETVLTVAWANFVNRVAFGLGLFMDE